MPLLLAPLALILLPLLEIGVFILVGSEIGVGWTLLLVVLSTVLGIAIMRRQTLRTLTEARTEARLGRVPERQIVHGALIALAGVLLVVPGFVTDAIGLLLFLPPVRDLLWNRMRSRIVVRAAGVPPHPGHRPPPAQAAPEIIELEDGEFRRRGADGTADSPWRKDDEDGGGTPPRPTLH